MNFDDLPDLVLIQVFSLCDTRTASSVAMTCKRNRKLVAFHVPDPWRRVTVEYSERAFSSICAHPALRFVNRITIRSPLSRVGSGIGRGVSRDFASKAVSLTEVVTDVLCSIEKQFLEDLANSGRRLSSVYVHLTPNPPLYVQCSIFSKCAAHLCDLDLIAPDCATTQLLLHNMRAVVFPNLRYLALDLVETLGQTLSMLATRMSDAVVPFPRLETLSLICIMQFTAGTPTYAPLPETAALLSAAAPALSNLFWNTVMPPTTEAEFLFRLKKLQRYHGGRPMQGETIRVLSTMPYTSRPKYDFRELSLECGTVDSDALAAFLTKCSDLRSLHLSVLGECDMRYFGGLPNMSKLDLYYADVDVHLLSTFDDMIRPLCEKSPSMGTVSVSVMCCADCARALMSSCIIELPPRIRISFAENIL